MKTSKIIPNRRFIFLVWSSRCIVLFPLRTPASWRSAKCTRRLSKVWRNWPNSKLICYSERGEPRLSFEYKFVGHPWKLLKLYPTVHAYLFFFTLYCIVSTENTSKFGRSHAVLYLYCFHWEHQQSWMSAKCTRRPFKVWRNLPKSKLICYSERGEPGLSFEYKFVGHPWKLQKLYPTVHAYLFFLTLYCIVSTENTSKLNECEVHTEAL